MAQPIRWDNVDVGSFSSAANLAVSGGDALTRAAQQLAGQAQGMRQQNIVNDERSTAKNTETALGQITAIKDLKELAAKEADGSYSPETLDGLTGGLIDQKAIRMALAGQDDTIRKEETDIYNYDRMGEKRNDDPLNRDFGADILNSDTIPELEDMRAKIVGSGLIDKNPMIAQINSRIKGINDKADADKQLAFTNGIASANLNLARRQDGRQAKAAKTQEDKILQDERLNQVILQEIQSQTVNAENQAKAVAAIDTEYGAIADTLGSDLMTNPTYAPEIAEAIKTLRAENPDLEEGQIQKQGVTLFKANKQEEYKQKIAESVMVQSLSDVSAKLVSFGTDINAPVSKVMAAIKQFESGTKNLFELDAREQGQVAMNTKDAQLEMTRSVAAADEVLAKETARRPIDVILSEEETMLSPEQALGAMITPNSDIQYEFISDAPSYAEDRRKEIVAQLGDGYYDPDTKKTLAYPGWVLQRAASVAIIKDEMWDPKLLKTTSDDIMKRHLQSEHNRDVLTIKRQENVEKVLAAQSTYDRAVAAEVAKVKKQVGKVEYSSKAIFDRNK